MFKVVAERPDGLDMVDIQYPFPASLVTTDAAALIASFGSPALPHPIWTIESWRTIFPIRIPGAAVLSGKPVRFTRDRTEGRASQSHVRLAYRIRFATRGAVQRHARFAGSRPGPSRNPSALTQSRTEASLPIGPFGKGFAAERALPRGTFLGIAASCPATNERTELPRIPRPFVLFKSGMTIGAG